jgi:hypothetical protein
VSTPTEAEAAFLGRLRDDLQRQIGATAEVLAVEQQIGTYESGLERITLVAVCRTGEHERTFKASGATVIEAYGTLVRSAAAERLAIAFSSLVDA